MRDPIVSILVVTYNHENYIEETLKSILDQKISYSFEIIVGNDASTDGTKIKLNEIQHQHQGILKIINQAQNVGFIQNYLSALKQCRGKYIASWEGDDYWVDYTKLQKEIDYLENNSDCGLVYTDFNILNENGELSEHCVKESDKNYLEGSVVDRMLKGDNQVMTLTVCLRSSLLGEEYYKFMNDPAILTADFPTWMWCAYQARFHFIPDVTAVYRRHENQITNAKDNLFVWKFMRSHVYIRKKFMSTMRYVPIDWKKIDINVNKEILFHSCKLNLKKEFGIASYKILTCKYRSFSFMDTIMYLSIKYYVFAKVMTGVRVMKNIILKSFN
jgi:glycosyltransferase involved in cell wall biosynthesis